MEVADFVAEALAGRQDIEPFAGGYRHSADIGTTTLTFHASSGADSRLTSIAMVESRFTPGVVPDFDDDGIAWLNRRAVFGSFFRDAHSTGCRATYPIDNGFLEPDWQARRLLNALSDQRAFGIAIGLMDLSLEHCLASRKMFRVPRHWATRLPSEGLEKVAHYLEQQFGLPATAGPASLVFEAPLTSGATTRIVDPEAETALISIRTDVQHPVAGVGYCVTIMPPRQPPSELLTMWCTKLNTLEHQQERFWPRLGAWGKRELGTRLVYGMFWPTDEADAGEVRMLALEMADRVNWIAGDLWLPGVGLHLQRDTA
ncbi:hypothetical protein [Plastoroseomonas hellenica]|uniref:Uncharacterized protein n=1 Tax=Plastoroseomonas hellenica TaxID=2687306 RepID=A0ABS5F1E7_9PROT|nr:hypothetical protein [Plastoroseomonas hellenica]MBR0643663.1 hypothetical protein [Plastoroseomonas hellenica]MBR0666379.1 hypothetical protein [Plastoroseomonas hellenica]